MILKRMEAHKFADIFPMIEGEELERLKQDIKESGLLQPIVLFEGKILDGRNRYKACKEIGIEPNFQEYKGEKPLEFVISLNLKRRHLNTGQRAVIAQEVMPMLEEEAEKRKVATQGRPNKLLEKIPTVKFHSAKEAQKIMQVNERDIRVVKKWKEQGKEKLIKEVKLGYKTISEGKKEERKEKIAKQREELQKINLEKPTGEYDVIVIDPPWEYEMSGFEDYHPQGNRGTTPYPTLTLEKLKDIKLPLKKNAIVWVWVTNSMFKEAFKLIESWGLERKTILTWDKQIMGVGHFLRNITEHCILCFKGKPFFNNTKWTTLISEKRTTHSTKPEIFYKMVDEICAGRKLDYFARKKREGWDVWGNEIVIK